MLATADPGWLLAVAEVNLPEHLVGSSVWGACGVLLVVAVLVATPALSLLASLLLTNPKADPPWQDCRPGHIGTTHQ